MLFRKCGCLVAHGKYIFRKSFLVWPCVGCKMISVFILPSNIIFRKTERERVCEWDRARAHREREREPIARDPRASTSPATQELRLRRRPRDFAPRTQIAVRLRLRIAPRSHPLTSPANLEAKIARLRLCTLQLRRLRTPSTSPRWHWDGTDRTEFTIEKLLGFDEFDWVWWIFFGWVLMNLTGSDEFFLVGFWWIWLDLCLSIEKLYYIFVWELRKCEKM